MDAATYIGLRLYIDTFAARDDAYVYDSRSHVAEPMTPEVLYEAIIQKHAVSGYTARHTDHGIVTNVGAIDFDKASVEQAHEVRRTMGNMGIPALLAHSRRGAHIWVASREVSAQAMRRALEQCVRLTDAHLLDPVPDPKPGKPNNMAAQIEIFPKAGTNDWACGALRLPLMTHPKTKMRYPVEDMDGKRLTKMIDVYHAVTVVDADTILKLGKDVPVEYPRGLGEYRQNSKREVIGESAVSLLTSLGVDRAQPGRNVRCPFHGDSHASMRIAPDDQRVWCKAPECDAFNGGRGLGTIMLAKMIRAKRMAA